MVAQDFLTFTTILTDLIIGTVEVTSIYDNPIIYSRLRGLDRPHLTQLMAKELTIQIGPQIQEEL